MLDQQILDQQILEQILDQQILDQQIYMYSPDSIPYTIPSLFSQHINDLSCNNITIQQTQDVGSAYIVSVPSGAKIYIDNVEQAVVITPARIDNIPSIPTEHTYLYQYKIGDSIWYQPKKLQ